MNYTAYRIGSDRWTDGQDTWSVYKGRKRVASYFTSYDAAKAWIASQA